MTLTASVEVMQARRDELPERSQAALDLLASDVVRFQGLVEDLLEISRFDAGAIRLHMEELLAAELSVFEEFRKNVEEETSVAETRLAELEAVLATVDRSEPYPANAHEIRRGKRAGTQKVILPPGLPRPPRPRVATVPVGLFGKQR